MMIIVLSLVLLTFILGAGGCEMSAEEFKKYYLPDDAKEVKVLGNGWAYFELDDVQYLFHKTYRSFTAVPQPAKR